MSYKTADLCDRFSESVQICQLNFNSYGMKAMFAGPIATVEVDDDNVLVRRALETVPKGTVLVVNGNGSKNCALVGDNLANIAISRELAGVIINGCIRDSAEIGKMEVAIFALGTHPLKSKKQGIGKTNCITNFGGVAWNPGDYVYADEDGVIISSSELSLE